MGIYNWKNNQEIPFSEELLVNTQIPNPLTEPIYTIIISHDNKKEVRCMDSSMDNVDTDTFQVIKDYYAKDKNVLYYFCDKVQ